MRARIVTNILQLDEKQEVHMINDLKRRLLIYIVIDACKLELKFESKN